MATLLVIDDEPSICWAFRQLGERLGHSVRVAASAEEGLAALTPATDLVITDIRLPGMDGIEAVREIARLRPGLPVIVITAHGTMQTAVEAIKAGAFEYVTKPVDLAEAEGVIGRALERGAVSEEVRRLQGAADLSGIVGTTPGMQEVFKKIGAVCTTDATVLITGESGTGKELVARAIHAHSRRARRPFEAINCASLPEGLVESELFGHEKGAFTGAIRTKPGRFEAAAGGTVFLDEVGDLPAPAQAKLLRFLEDRSFTRVGGVEPLTADVRLVSATNRDLRALVAEGSYREDLFYRLNVVSIALPPLRDRKADIPRLVARFLRDGTAPSKEISEAALERLMAHDWPGNVRELRNAVEQSVVMSRGGPVGVEHLPARVVRQGPGPDADAAAVLVARWFADAPEGAAWDVVTEQWERLLIARALEDARGSLSAASRKLGINRATLRKKVEKFGLRGAAE
ncbi:MAG: sigma-54-dependent Fis family transcriptional regulator [Candidatus Brocadiae bacterium]|nr:sigma-54-dependent Fis family transcriptional regulator [Candidatus Brocadiia bacterium]